MWQELYGAKNRQTFCFYFHSRSGRTFRDFFERVSSGKKMTSSRHFFCVFFLPSEPSLQKSQKIRKRKHVCFSLLRPWWLKFLRYYCGIYGTSLTAHERRGIPAKKRDFTTIVPAIKRSHGGKNGKREPSDEVHSPSPDGVSRRLPAEPIGIVRVGERRRLEAEKNIRKIRPSGKERGEGIWEKQL